MDRQRSAQSTSESTTRSLAVRTRVRTPASFPPSHPSSFPSSDPPSHDETRTQKPKKPLQIRNIREDESTPISMAQEEKSNEK
jgi:hypothetical protein